MQTAYCLFAGCKRGINLNGYFLTKAIGLALAIQSGQRRDWQAPIDG